MPGVWRLGAFPWGGHLGPSVSALVDGQLDDESTERAWAHVMECDSCRRQVEHEGWVKRRLAQMAGSEPVAGEPSPSLLGSLYDLDPVERETRAAWAAVDELEERGRGRRRVGLAAAGVGSVSAAVLGFSALSGAPLGIGGGPAAPPATSLTRTTPTAGPLAQVRPPASSSPTGASAFVPFSGWNFSAVADASTTAASFRSTR